MRPRHDPETRRDRLAALRTGGVEATVALYCRIPALAELASGRGPLANPFGRNTTDDLGRLADFLSSDFGVQVGIVHANRIEYQLLLLCAWNGGLLSREGAIEQSGADPEVLDTAVAGLAELLLVDPSAGWLALRPGVLEWIALPGHPVRAGMEHVPNHNLDPVLEELGIEAGPRKWERVDAIEAALRDPDTVNSVLARFDEPASRMFSRIASHGLLELDAVLGSDVRDFRDNRHTLERLLASGLVGMSIHDRRVWVWLDVIVSLNGRLITEWTPIEPSLARPTRAGRVASLPSVVGAIDRLLSHVGANPTPALKAGGLGVTAVRAIAKALGRSTSEIGLLAAIAIEAGLLGLVVVEKRGRGRNQQVSEEWRPTTEAVVWESLPATERWSRIVATWLTSTRVPVTGAPVERYDFGYGESRHWLARSLFIHSLVELPEEAALDVEGIVEWLSFRYPNLLGPDSIRNLVDQTRLLGLIDDGEPAGVTPLGRALLAGADLDGLVAGGPATFVIQADHTIIAPPDLDPEVASELERIAALESNAGARIYRLDERSLVGAFDAGLEADDIVSFLKLHSPTGLPGVVERTVLDAAGRHGRLQVGPATTWIASDDPALISSAVAVKRAKLVAVSPTAAVSELSRSKVMAALRGAGLVAVDASPGDEPRSAPAPLPVARSADAHKALEPIDLEAAARQVHAAPVREEVGVGASFHSIDDLLDEMGRFAPPAEGR